MYLEALFVFLSTFYPKGMTSLSFQRIEQIIGRELCESAKQSTWYWCAPRIKALQLKYGIEIESINTNSGLVYFKIL